MAAIDNWNLASQNASDFAKRTHMLLLKVASQVAGEASIDNGGTYPQTAVQKRHQKAVTILNDRKFEQSSIFRYSILGNNTLSEASTDNDIEFMINAVFNDVAGVTYEDLKDFVEKTTRVMTYKEANRLIDHSEFVEGVEARALHLSTYHRDFHQATVDAGDWATLTNVQKKQYNFGVQNLERGSLEDNVAFARVWLNYLINDAVGVPMPDDGFNVEVVSKTLLETTAIIEGAQVDKAYTVMMDNVQIATPE